MRHYDFSGGSSNTYKVEPRHQLILPCFHCEIESTIIFEGNQYYRYYIVGKDYANVVWPELTPEQLDLIITGIHPECSDAFYGSIKTED